MYAMGRVEWSGDTTKYGKSYPYDVKAPKTLTYINFVLVHAKRLIVMLTSLASFIYEQRVGCVIEYENAILLPH